jgi:hypothetical protein
VAFNNIEDVASACTVWRDAVSLILSQSQHVALSGTRDRPLEPVVKTVERLHTDRNSQSGVEWRSWVKKGRDRGIGDLSVAVEKMIRRAGSNKLRQWGPPLTASVWSNTDQVSRASVSE